MNRKSLKSLILKRMDELDRFYAAEYPDAEKIVANERDIVYEVAGMMARAGFGELHAAGLALDTRENPEAVKSYLARCLRALRPKRRAASKSAAADSGMLTPPQIAQRYGVSPDTVRGWITAGHLRAVNVGRGKRPQYRVPAEALRELDAKRPPKVIPASPVQRRRRRKVELPFRRYS